MALTKITRAILDTGVSDSSDATAITIDSNENIGIGTTSPSMKVNISHGDQDGLRFNCANTAETFIDFGDTDDNDIGRISYDHADNHMAFRTNNSERMRIDSSGRVGLGTTSPAAELHINDTGGLSRIRLTGTAANADDFEFGQGTTGVANGGFEIYDVNESAIRFVIDSSGTVLVGNLAASQGASTTGGTPTRMSVNSSAGNEIISFNSSTYTHYGSCYADSGGTGLFGKGTRTAAIVGTGIYNYTSQTPDIIYFYVDGTLRYTISSSGGANASDEKFKENIEDITYGLDTIKSLQPRKFKWKDKGEVTGEDSIGFIAQEVEPLISEVVSSPTDGAEGGEVGKVLNYSALTAVLTKAIQEQQEQIEALQSEINTLKGG